MVKFISRKIWLVTAVLMLQLTAIYAYDFKADYGGKTIFYNKGKDGKSAIVTYSPTEYTGIISIPDTVINTDKEWRRYEVTSIGEHAFDNCNNVECVILPNTIKRIEDNAFSNCSKLIRIDIPSSVTYIGSSAFIRIGSDDPYIPWFSELYENAPDGLFYINSVLYKYKGTMPNNTIITLKEGTSSISGQVFYNCIGLTSIIIPESVTSIGAGAFAYCRNLSSITLPNGITSIENGTFDNCYGLRNIILPNSVTSVGGSAFNNCYGLTSVTMGSNVTTIWHNAFAYCSRLTSITIPNSVITMGDGVFDRCSSLTGITIPDNVTSIGRNTFTNCTGLKNVSIGKSVTSIGSQAFFGCTGLKNITIPASVTNISEGAFAYCYYLTGVYIKSETPPVLDGNPFNASASFSVSKDTLYVPSITAKVKYEASNWDYFFSAIIERRNTGIHSVSKETTVSIINSIIDVNSPFSEIIRIYSINGMLLLETEKKAGKASFNIDKIRGVVIITGSSGWSRKIIIN